MKKILTTSALVAGLTAGAAQAQQHWNLQSTYAGSLPQLGTLGIRIADMITQLSNGEIEVTFQNPGGVVPALEVFDAVGSGAVEAGWSTPGYWAGRVPALQLLAAVPFGPRASEYLAWMKFGGGQEFLEELYEPHNIHSVICAVIAPEASGWFRNEIHNTDELRGLTMRFFGLGAKVMERMGVSTQLLAGGDIFPALELGTIDATEFSMPAIDLNLGFYQVASHYYFPGWHQQSTFFDLMINLDLWESLTEHQQQMINTICDANIAYGLAEGEAIQIDALETLENEHGVQIHRWSDEDLGRLEAAWIEVATELAAEDADFARVYESYTNFRQRYTRWRDLAYLD
ncbi:TRAP transporter substrate-binding protein [Pararhodobacter aggregans]|uniref:TRAP transporter substrate-binding protein n=1 Tax=Pararhodobacter aggregans TaxID=404875 RepID=UPI003A8FD7C5